jgi:D-alanyl-D-alanine carboxypeptidase
MISNLEDLHRWAVELYQGDLLSRRTQAERVTFVPTGSPGFGYGLGIADINGWIGHNGEVPGYETLDVYLPVQRMTLVLMINTDVPHRNNAANLPVNLLGQAVTSVISPDNVF